MRRPTLALSVGTLLAGAVVLTLLLRDRPADEAPGGDVLEPIAESPRPPIRAEPPRATLRPGLPAPARPPASDHRSLVEERNELAREHRRLVAAYEAGVVTIEDVEDAELRLLDARHRLGEIDALARHRARVVLLARALERSHARVEAGILPPSDEATASLALELERLLAGDANTYAASRESFLADERRRRDARVEVGLESEKDAKEEFARAEARFPPADVARDHDR